MPAKTAERRIQRANLAMQLNSSMAPSAPPNVLRYYTGKTHATFGLFSDLPHMSLTAIALKQGVRPLGRSVGKER